MHRIVLGKSGRRTRSSHENIEILRKIKNKCGSEEDGWEIRSDKEYLNVIRKPYYPF
jgi:hypothetical protein